MNFKMPKLSDALLGGFLLGLLLLGLVVVCFLSRRKGGLFGRRQSIPHEDIASISRRYQSYQDFARVPYGNGNPPQIDRIDIINLNEGRFSSATRDPEISQQMVCEGGQMVSHDQQCSIGEDVKNKDGAEPNVDLELENRRLKDQQTCKICMDHEIGVVFQTCGHLISCVQCARALNDCPLCRQPIDGTVKTYMP